MAYVRLMPDLCQNTIDIPLRTRSIELNYHIKNSPMGFGDRQINNAPIGFCTRLLESV